MGISELHRLASRIIRECVRVGRGENVLVEAIDLDELTLPELLAAECAGVGAHPVLVVRPEGVLRSKLLRWEPKELEFVPAHELCIYSNLDVRVSVYSSHWPGWWREIDEEKKASVDRSYQAIREAFPKEDFRNLQVTMPTRTRCRERGMDFDRLFEDFLSGVNVDYLGMAELAGKLRDKFKDTGRVEVESEEGARCWFSTEGRMFLVEDGVISKEDLAQGVFYAEIPTGEVFTAPVEDSAEGRAVFSHVPGIGRLEVTFRSGRVVEARGEASPRFWDMVKQATGESDRIAEFAIGLNPKVSPPNEKALGSVHIAIGKNNHIGGKSESSLHLDMIIPRPTVMADGDKVIESGQIL